MVRKVMKAKTRVSSSRTITMNSFDRHPAVNPEAEADASGASEPSLPTENRSVRSAKKSSPLSSRKLERRDSATGKSPKKHASAKRIRASPSLLAVESQPEDLQDDGAGQHHLPLQIACDTHPEHESLGLESDAGSPVPSVDFSEIVGSVSRGLNLSNELPIPAKHLLEFKKFVQDFDMEDYYLLNIASSKARRLVLRDLREQLAPLTHLEAERILQLSYLAHQRFVAGDEDTPVEHLAIACAIGQILNSGTFIGEDLVEKQVAPTDSLQGLLEIQVPAVMPGEGKGFGVAASNKSGAFSVAEYLESLAAELRKPATTDVTSEMSKHALCRVIDSLRAQLPAALAELTIKGLLEANDGLRRESAQQNNVAPPTPVSVAAKLGRSYRLGALSAEERHHAHQMNKVGALAATADAPDAREWPFGREARRSPADRQILQSLRKVIQGGDEFAHLNSKQKLKAMSRLVRQQLHEADLDRKSSLNDAEGPDYAHDGDGSAVGGEITRGGGPSCVARDGGDGGDGGDESDSNTEGDSCGDTQDSRDSRESGETYQKDSFCGSDGDDAESMDERDRKRAKQRRESANSLGTPSTKKRERAELGAPLVKPVERDRPSLVLLGDEDLVLWKSGPVRFKMGFHWESYLYHKQQFDNYKAHRGRYSDRTFKSIIDAKLIPTVCSSCGFARSKWSNVSDARLILRIERVLRPSKSTDFAMELKEIRLERYGSEPLQTSYVTFAEKFLAKVAEAADAGRPVKPVVVKAAYKTAVDKELPLKTWLEGDKWRGVDHAHKRLLRKLREARSWEAMTQSVRKKMQRADEHGGHTSEDGHASSRRGASGGRSKRRSNATGKSHGKSRSKSARRARSNSSGTFSKVKSKPAKQSERLRTWKGCDSRGESWHSDRELFECYKKPCQAHFCQRCARHGHTADYCRVPDGTAGLNTSGYFQEQLPGKAGPKKPPARSNSSGKRADRESDASGSGSDSEPDRGPDDESARGNTSRRSNSSRGQRGRGRL
jgi:hypothetical protein